jgi:Mrp family chromosome partitioning ATPase
VSDTRILAQHADAIVYLVRWNATQQRMVRAGLEALRQVNVEVGGLVLNRIKASGSEQYGYYGKAYT